MGTNRTPAWARLFAGWLVGVAGLGLWCESPPPQPPFCTLEPSPPPRPAPTPRDWRALPGIGRRRALDLARALWEAGVRDPRTFDPTRVHGIGPATAATIAAYLEAGDP